MEKKQIFKIVSVSAVVVLLGAFALNGWALNQKADKGTVLATVDTVKITQGEVDERISDMLGAQAMSLPPEKMAEIRDRLNQKVLDGMIVETLLTKAVEEGKIAVSDDEIEAMLIELKATLPKDVNFAEYLEQVGFSEAELREMLQKNLRIRKLLEQQFAGTKLPTEKEVEKYYETHTADFETPESVQVRHILIGVSPEDTEAAKAEKMKKAEQVRDQVIKEKNFEATAKKVSDCPSKAKGGNLGFVERGQTVKAFEDAAFGGKVGEIGPVVETRFGYHIIEVLDHKDAANKPFSEVKEEIVQRLTAEKKQAAAQAYIDSLKAKASIVYHKQESKDLNPA